ncbi:hypothetical protein OsI_30764 [Oryza sativa Indica Group]|uniref:Uncharacterized protein n=1 Tax=Oryza sativa subsp. indica TaxID=39946 RepID=B8BE03_ORYSI|nr:hypothetical protein OsI_30764 [Oryza sativa Indica Group]
MRAATRVVGILPPGSGGGSGRRRGRRRNFLPPESGGGGPRAARIWRRGRPAAEPRRAAAGVADNDVCSDVVSGGGPRAALIWRQGRAGDIGWRWNRGGRSAGQG